MATIELYANGINSMPNLVDDICNSVNNLKSEFTTLKSKSQSINRNICNLDDVISSISTSTQTQEDKVNALKNLAEDVKNFASDVGRIDSDVANAINKGKNDFYDKYDYLRPNYEKNVMEQFWDGCKSGLDTAAEWCKEHWKLVVTIVLVIVAVAVLIALPALGGSFAAFILMGAAKGLISGAVLGGLVGGGMNMLMGGSFLEGFEKGAFEGAISGAIFGGLSMGLASKSGFTQAFKNVNPMGLTKETGGIGRFLYSWEVTGKVQSSYQFVKIQDESVKIFWKNVVSDMVAGAGASVLGDMGDIGIKGESISFGEIIDNIGFSAGVSGISSLLSQGMPKIKIPGINEGDGSWKHIWESQVKHYIKYGTPIPVKTYFKKIGASILDYQWDIRLEFFNVLMDKCRESCSLLPQH